MCLFDPRHILEAYTFQDVSAPAEDQEEDLKRLMAIEEKLLFHDPTFTEEHTHAAIQQQRSPLLCAFKPGYSEWDVGGANRIHLNTERYRACETWFSPFMAGLDSAGLGEVIQNILARFTYEEKGRLVKVRFELMRWVCANRERAEYLPNWYAFKVPGVSRALADNNATHYATGDAD